MANETVIKVRVDESGTIQFFDKLGNSMGETEKIAENTAQGFSRIGASLVTLDSAINLASRGFSLLQGAATIGIDAINRGSQIDDISSAFGTLATKAGAVSDVFLNELNTAVANTIPNFDLMQQANELLLGGLKPDQIVKSAEAVRAFGEVTGQDAAAGMEALSNQLLRGNTRFTDSLGLVVDVSKAQSDLAASLGKTTATLTEQEKTLAIRNETIKVVAEQTDTLGKVTLDAGDRVAQLNTILSNTKDEFLQTAANNEALNGAIGNLGEVLKSVDFKPIIAGMSAMITLAASAISKLAGLASAVSKYVNHQTDLDIKLAKTGAAFQKYDAQMIKVIRTLEEGNKGAVEKAIEQYKALEKELNKVATSEGFDAKVYNAIQIELGKLGEQVSEAAKQFGLYKGQADPAADLTNELTKEIAKSTDALTKQALAAGGAAAAVVKGAKEASEAAKANPIEIPIILGAKRTGGSGASGGLDLKGLSEALSSTLGQGIAEGLSQGIELALNGGHGEDYRAAISQTLFDGLAKGADSYIPGSGAFVSAFEPLFAKGLEKMFGGEHAGTTARKAADKFFADAFDADRLFVIIDGQLKQIEDLVFQGETLFGGNSSFTDGSFDNFFQGLPEAAQAAFGGVGLAFEELLGTGEEISGQIGAVLANNIGGSLNNLQLLVQSSGKSFEELRGSVVEAFLDGKVSALEAQTALNGLAQVAQDGIPDAIGATIQAFDNMQAAGAKGGRALIDAFKDIGFEAKELGIKDFGALAANIIASGKYSTEQVNAYFDELRRQGITNVEQLTSASTEQLLSIGSALQASGYLDEAASQTTQLIEDINNLPDSKDFTINVKANIDSSAKEAIKVISGGSINPQSSAGIA